MNGLSVATTVAAFVVLGACVAALVVGWQVSERRVPPRRRPPLTLDDLIPFCACDVCLAKEYRP